MKKSRLIQIIREEVRKKLQEAYGMESMYYSAPSGFEQMQNRTQVNIQRFEDPEKWKIVAMQLGAVIQDRGDDWIAVMPNQDKIGTFSKVTQLGTLNL